MSLGRGGMSQHATIWEPPGQDSLFGSFQSRTAPVGELLGWDTLVWNSPKVSSPWFGSLQLRMPLVQDVPGLGAPNQDAFIWEVWDAPCLGGPPMVWDDPS